jgi:hypothetical protein
MPSGGDQDSDERVLSPDELDIEEEEDVASLGDGRYVIGSDGPPDTDDVSQSTEESSGTPESPPDANQFEQARPDQQAPSHSGTADSQQSPSDSQQSPKASTQGGSSERRPNEPLTGREVKDWLGDELANHSSSYAYHIAAKSVGSVTHQQLATDDVGAAFDGLLVWYARQLSEGTPVDEALGILLAESTVQVRYPTSRLVSYLEAHDLGPEDSIGDLVDAVSAEGGLVFPKQQ